MKKKITLAIETAVRGGSLSILEGEKEIDYWIGETGISKVEDILEQILRLIKVNRIEKKEIDLIAVSRGPGSFTGARIGLATALGLKTAWNCEIVGVSVFEAMLLKAKKNGRVITAIPVGRKQISWQLFDNENPPGKAQNATPASGTISIFLKSLTTDKSASFILQGGLHQIVLDEDRSIEESRIEFVNNKIATLIGLNGQIENRFKKCQRNNSEKRRFTSDNIKVIYPTGKL
ncbi:MAG: tRNA (adenosine(37)-N6)-threonylcarbamoyltransferase complex dimerization subunit type 1 TsaB [Pyrinomonadaceae bacterium]